MGVFKSYDIRGIWGVEWDGETARAIGRRLPRLLSAREIVVGRDVRLSSEEALHALTDGIRDAGCAVADIGLCDTPALYFATAFHGFDGSAMITASHNPPEYNGLKISRRNAVPVGYDTGLDVLERTVKEPWDVPDAGRGGLRSLDIRADYLAHLDRFRGDIGGLSAVIDCSNGMAGIFLPDVLKGLPGTFSLLFEKPDGRFPNHAPNPLVEENLAALKKEVLARGADLGICFDGDADRVMFVDERGRFVSPDLITGILALWYFRHHPERMAGSGRAATYDVRTSRGVVEFLASLGADPRICKVGHSHAKKLLRDANGILGGELAGHYYFRENWFCDSGMIAALIVLSVLSREKMPLSRMARGVSRYWYSGEINFEIPDGRSVVEKVRADYPDGKLTAIDGVRIDYPDWWFCLRTSNTEPLLRLVLEATTEEGLSERRRELEEKIRRHAGIKP